MKTLTSCKNNKQKWLYSKCWNGRMHRMSMEWNCVNVGMECSIKQIIFTKKVSIALGLIRKKSTFQLQSPKSIWLNFHSTFQRIFSLSLSPFYSCTILIQFPTVKCNFKLHVQLYSFYSLVLFELQILLCFRCCYSWALNQHVSSGQVYIRLQV